MTCPAPPRRWLFACGLLGALGLALLARLRLEPWAWWVNPDEGIFHLVATTPDDADAAAIIRGNAHPPLHYWTLRALAAQGSDDLLLLRLPSLLAGLALVLALAWLGLLAGGGLGAAFGAAVGALSPDLVVQSVLLRQYTLQVLGLTLGLGALFRFLATGRVRWLVLLSPALTYAVLVHYASYVVVGGMGLVLLGLLLAGRLARRQVALLVLAYAPVLGAMAWQYAEHLRPYVIQGAAHLDAQAGWLKSRYRSDVGSGIRGLADAAATGLSRPLTGVLLVAGAYALGRALRRRTGLPVFLALAVVALAIALSMARLMPLGGGRHCDYLIPVFVALGARGLGDLRARLAAGVPAPSGSAAPGAWRSRWLSLRPGLLCAGLAAAVLARGLPLFLLDVPPPKADGAPEQVVRRDQAQAVATFLSRPSGAAWLTDHQTALLLLPLVPRSERRLLDDPDAGGRRFVAWGRSFHVLERWSFPVAAQGPDDPVERLLAALGRRGAVGDGRLGLVLGGWQGVEARRLVEELVGPRLGGPGLGGPGSGGAGSAGPGGDVVGDARLGAAVVDLAALRRARLERAASPPSPAR